jgi:hypothetical protein
MHYCNAPLSSSVDRRIEDAKEESETESGQKDSRKTQVDQGGEERPQEEGCKTGSRKVIWPSEKHGSQTVWAVLFSDSGVTEEMGRTTRLTPELIQAICERIRVGTYPYIAAAACGIPRSTYYGWLKKADKKGSLKIYRELRDRVGEAGAVARSSAELRVFKDRPLEWLRLGPGRERPDEPGWTETAQTIRVEGGDTPVQLESSVFNMIPTNTIAEGLDYLAELGYIQQTELGGKLLPGQTGNISNEVIDVEPVQADESDATS